MNRTATIKQQMIKNHFEMYNKYYRGTQKKTQHLIDDVDCDDDGYWRYWTILKKTHFILRGTQKKVNTYRVLFWAILIFSEMVFGENNGIFRKTWILRISLWSPVYGCTTPAKCIKKFVLLIFWGISKSKTKSKLFQVKSKKVNIERRHLKK